MGEHIQGLLILPSGVTIDTQHISNIIQCYFTLNLSNLSNPGCGCEDNV